MEGLLDEFRSAVVDHAENTYAGNADKVNEAYFKMQGVFLKLVAAGRDGALFTLYEDPEPWVQMSAAARTLELDEEKALVKLRELATTRNGLTRSTAKVIIEEWLAGNLRFRNAEK
jgi:hypothetical protein